MANKVEDQSTPHQTHQSVVQATPVLGPEIINQLVVAVLAQICNQSFPVVDLHENQAESKGLIANMLPPLAQGGKSVSPSLTRGVATNDIEGSK